MTATQTSTLPKSSATYEVNANGNRSYASESAAKVADVAATWAKQGHSPKAFAIFTDPMIRCVEAPVTSKQGTKAALLRAGGRGDAIDPGFVADVMAHGPYDARRLLADLGITE